MMDYKLTEYSHGAGCGCKIAPDVLKEIIGEGSSMHFDHLLVGNDMSDDAAIVSLDSEIAIISTTDFFMPIVDDANQFGAIAATNAISDIYAMGGTPIMAIAILGWPIDKLPAQVASKVLQGGRGVCEKAGIPLAGGHSIDSPEPIFGLAVTGKVNKSNIKTNSGAKPGDLIYLTKPLGVGIITTAQKKGLVEENDLLQIVNQMLQLNAIGESLSQFKFVHAITDVTGFGLGGHLLEVCKASSLAAEISWADIPILPQAQKYLDMNCIPGGTNRNWDNYGSEIKIQNPDQWKIIADPQTSGGLLIAVDPAEKLIFEELMRKSGYQLNTLGSFTELNSNFSIQII